MTFARPQFTYTTGTRTYPATAPGELRGTTVPTFEILMDGRTIVTGTGTEQHAQERMAELVEAHTPTVVTFADGTTVTLARQKAAMVIGLSADGYVVVESGSQQYGLTACCDTSATGTEDGIACRSCYADVDWALGGHMDVAVPVQPLPASPA